MVARGLTVNGSASTATSPASISLLPGGAGGPLNLSLGLVVKRIWAISQKEQDYKIRYVLVTHWEDCRLSWSESGPSRLVVGKESTYWGNFWYPKIYIAEEESRDDSMTSERLIIMRTGATTYYMTMISTMHCQLNFENLPHDRHECSLTFQLPQYLPRELSLQWSTGRLSSLTLSNLSNSGWQFSDRSEWRQEEVTDDSDLNLLGKSLQTKFFISRRAHHMVKSNILPCVIYWFISYLAMWVDASAVPGRAALHTLPILMLANKLNAVQASLPEIAYSTKLSYFLFFSLFVATMQLLEFCAVNAAARIAKSMVGLEKTVASDSEAAGGGAEVPERRRLCYRIAVWIRDWLDTHSRWSFPLIYVGGSCIYLVP